MNEFDLDIIYKNYRKEFNWNKYLGLLSKLKTLKVNDFILKMK